ncbi:MAG: NifU family protein [Halobacteriales archaeon]|nr:NifU family protein [Halobacteriales archaeon]
MSATPADPAADVREQVGRFLQRNFPQIGMHGGEAAVEGLDLETGEVWIQLGGACSGCGISPMTIQAIQQRLVAEIEEIDLVHADAGFGGMGAPSPGHDPSPEAPF